MRLKEVDGFFVDQSIKERALPNRLRTDGQMLYRYMDRIYSTVPVSKLSANESAKMCDVRLEYFNTFVDEKYNNNIYHRLLTTGLYSRRAERILDFGCGNGYFTNYINLLLSPKVLVGIDISTKAIEMANNFYPALDWVKVDDQMQLPFPSANFDLIVSGFVMHFDIGEQLIKELARVLKDDGCFVFNIYHRKYLQDSLFKKLDIAGFKIECLPSSRNFHHLMYRALKRPK